MTDAPLRLLHVIDGLKVGGAEMMLLGMVRSYLRQGHSVSVAHFSPGPLGDDYRDLGVPVTRISRRGLADPVAPLRLMGLIRSERPDVVHTHLRKSDLVGQLCAGLAGVPVRVSTGHNTDPWRKSAPLTAVHRLCTRRCQRVIAVSQEVHDYFVTTGAYRPEKVVTIENGIDLERFDPERVTALDRKSAWGVAPESPIIGVIGRLEPQKGHAVLLEAAAAVTREAPAVRFVVIGDGSLRAELEEQRSRLGLDEHVIFAGISRNIPETLATLDLVASSSLWEGLPLTLLEAMAMARPVVATAVGGIPQVLEDGRSGLLVAPGSPQELSRGLLRLLDDPDLARRLGSAGREVVQRRYGAARMHRDVLAVYRSLGA